MKTLKACKSETRGSAKLWENSFSIENRVLCWNPHGQRRRGKPRNSWGTTIEEDAVTMAKCWRERLRQDKSPLAFVSGCLILRSGVAVSHFWCEVASFEPKPLDVF